eukprot:TRINITY_DN12081_c0_g1_i1.p1 TRINITY_DN12081_c0_g1~~TRINITY_DN12081_c0_g1_i1.p1  ORF type:complete len:414 (-),score=55.98 TRINITY_DN12081_c0_g1_i1:39-1280(-)
MCSSISSEMIRSLYCGKRMLAPLVGGSDLSFRLLCRKYGAQVTFTEMCIAEYYLERDVRTVKDYVFEFDPLDRPCIAQLAGNTPEPIIKLANHEILRGKVDAIDLNCGCPQGFALEKNYGCALLGHPELLTDLCKQVAANISLPLSVKMRLHEDVPTTIGIMERLINVGVKAITIHGRYWWQKGEKRGLADWDSIKQIKSHFPDFPIIGNGDILSYADFDEHQRLSGVDSTMAGYGALLNPGIFSDTPIPLGTMLSDYIAIARQHHNKLIDVQRHIAWMMKRNSSADFKANLFQCKNIPEIQSLLEAQPVPIFTTIPPLAAGEVDHIVYPVWSKKIEDMSASERKKHARRQQKHEKRMNRKRERESSSMTTLPESSSNGNDLAPSSPSNREPATKAVKIEEDSTPSSSTSGMK